MHIYGTRRGWVNSCLWFQPHQWALLWTAMFENCNYWYVADSSSLACMHNAHIRRNNSVIITSKRRRDLDVVLTQWQRCYCVTCPLQGDVCGWWPVASWETTVRLAYEIWAKVNHVSHCSRQLESWLMSAVQEAMIFSVDVPAKNLYRCRFKQTMNKLM